MKMPLLFHHHSSRKEKHTVSSETVGKRERVWERKKYSCLGSSIDFLEMKFYVLLMNSKNTLPSPHFPAGLETPFILHMEALTGPGWAELRGKASGWMTQCLCVFSASDETGGLLLLGANITGTRSAIWEVMEVLLRLSLSCSSMQCLCFNHSAPAH